MSGKWLSIDDKIIDRLTWSSRFGPNTDVFSTHNTLTLLYRAQLIFDYGTFQFRQLEFLRSTSHSPYWCFIGEFQELRSDTLLQVSIRILFRVAGNRHYNYRAWIFFIREKRYRKMETLMESKRTGTFVGMSANPLSLPRSSYLMV